MSDDYVFTLGAVSFGDGQLVTVAGFDPGAAAWRTQDTPEPMGDSVAFGRDYLEGPTWAFQMLVKRPMDPVAALAASEQLAGVWRNQAGRHTPGAVLALRYGLPGRVRVVYGRPRRWAASVDNRMVSGVIPITADFQCADALHYSDVEDRVDVGLVPASFGGLVSPFVSPLTTVGGSTRTGVVDVGGTAPAWCRVRLTGPGTNLLVRVGAWEFGLAGSLAAGEWVEASGAPWARMVLRQDGTSGGSLLTRRTRLSQLQLTPGRTEVLFTGIDATNTAKASVWWRPAYHSL